MADKQLSVNFVTKGAQKLGGDIDDITEKTGGLKKGLAQVGKEAAIAFSILSAGYKKAWDLMDKSIDKFNEWDKELRKVQGSLGLTDQETRKLSATLQNLATGELASIPGVFEHLGEAARTYLESGGDMENLTTDLSAAFKFAQVNGENYSQTLEYVLGVTDAYNIANGNTEQTLNQLKIAQLNTNKPLEQLARGLEKGSGVANAFNLDIEEMIALTAGWASTGERATTMSSALVAIMDEFNLKTFPELIELLEKANQGQVDFGSLSQQNKRYLGALANQVGQVTATYTDLQAGTDYLNQSFAIFSQSTLSETTRAQNELAAAQLETGERMQEMQPVIEQFRTNLQLTVMKLSEWAIKNPEWVGVIAGGIMMLRGAFLALKASNPVGWIMAAIGAVVSLISLISHDATAAALDAARANKQMLEKQKASIDARRDEISATGLLEKATKDLTDAQRDQVDEYHRLTDQSSKMTVAIAEAAVQTALLAEEVALEAAAEELATGAFEGTLEARLRSLGTQEEINKAQEVFNSVSTKTNDNTERFVMFLQEALGYSESTAKLIAERNIDAEEMNTLQDYLNAAQSKYNTLAESAKIIQDEQTANLLKHLDIYEEIKGVMNGNVDVTIAEEAAIRRKLALMLSVAKVRHEENQEAYNHIKMLYEAGSISYDVYRAALERLNESRISLNKITELVTTAGSALDEINRGGIEEDTSGVGDYRGSGEPGGGTGDPEQEIEEQEDIGPDPWEEEFQARMAHEEELAAARKEMAAEAAEEEFMKRLENQVEMFKKAEGYAKATASVFSGVLEDGFENVGENFKNLLLGAADAMIQKLITSAFTELFLLIISLLSGGIGGGLKKAAGGMKGLVPHAKGGYVDQPTAALIGEAGGETIIPDDVLMPYVRDYGAAMGSMMAIADMQGSKVQQPNVNVAAPQVSVNVPPPQFVVGPDGIYMLSEQGANRAKMREGV